MPYSSFNQRRCKKCWKTAQEIKLYSIIMITPDGSEWVNLCEAHINTLRIWLRSGAKEPSREVYFGQQTFDELK